MCKLVRLAASPEALNLLLLLLHLQEQHSLCSGSTTSPPRLAASPDGLTLLLPMQLKQQHSSSWLATVTISPPRPAGSTASS
jgi:hypothetical protein